MALIGASSDARKVTGRPQSFLQANRTSARIFPINPNRDQVQGVPAFKSLADVPEPIEHAYVLLDNDAAVAAVADCGDAGVPVVTVLADGFAEAGPQGLARQSELLEISQRTGIRIIGPNSMGVADTTSRFICTTNAAFAAEDLKTGRYGVLSQSGSIIGTLLSRGHARGVHFSFFVSLGNEADLGLGELGSALVDHEETDAFVLFMETIRRPRDIAAFAAAAHARGKPIIAYKLGRSPLGQELAVSHTGAIVGSDAAANCSFDHHGIHRVDLFETVFELPGLLVTGCRMTERRPRTATVVTTTGGGGAMVVDRLGALGVDVVGAGANAIAEVARTGFDLTGARLVDVTLAGANYDTMKAVLTALISDPESGVIVVAIGSSSQFFPEIAVHPIIDAVKEIGPGGAPVVGFPVPEAPEAIQLLAQSGITAARTPESCAEAIARYFDDLKPVARSIGRPVAAVSAAIAGTSRSILNEVEAGNVLASLGVQRPPEVFLQPSSELPDRLNVSFPVAAKIVTADLPHKTEAGAVALNIADVAGLRTAIDQMRQRVAAHAPKAQIDGVLIQQMVSGQCEAVLGMTRDPSVGTTITLAAGGTLAEIYNDFTMRMAPVSLEQAHAMIEEVKGLAVIRGYRNLPHGDTEALAETIANFSRIALEERVLEAEVNPLIIGAVGKGCVAVDALIRLSEARSASPAAPRRPRSARVP